MKLTDFLGDVGRPVAYYPQIRHICGSVTAAIFFCQFTYWRGKGENKEGWIYKSQPEIEDETGLTREEQETARRKLRDRGILTERKKGIPCRLYYLLDLDRVNLLWEDHIASKMSNKNEDYQQNGQIIQTCSEDSRSQAQQIPADMNEEFPLTTTENTTEITADKTTKRIITPLAENDESISATITSNNLIKTEWTLTPPSVDEEQKKSESKSSKVGFDYATGKFTNLAGTQYLDIWADAYPAINLIQEIKKAAAWLLSNPKNRKTDLPRFLNNWLQKAQNQTPGQGGGPARPFVGTGKGTEVRTTGPESDEANAVRQANRETIRLACERRGIISTVGLKQPQIGQ